MKDASPINKIIVPAAVEAAVTGAGNQTALPAEKKGKGSKKAKVSPAAATTTSVPPKVVTGLVIDPVTTDVRWEQGEFRSFAVGVTDEADNIIVEPIGGEDTMLRLRGNKILWGAVRAKGFGKFKFQVAGMNQDGTWSKFESVGFEYKPAAKPPQIKLPSLPTPVVTTPPAAQVAHAVQTASPKISMPPKPTAIKPATPQLTIMNNRFVSWKSGDHDYYTYRIINSGNARIAGPFKGTESSVDLHHHAMWSEIQGGGPGTYFFQLWGLKNGVYSDFTSKSFEYRLPATNTPVQTTTPPAVLTAHTPPPVAPVAPAFGPTPSPTPKAGSNFTSKKSGKTYNLPY